MVLSSRRSVLLGRVAVFLALAVGESSTDPNLGFTKELLKERAKELLPHKVKVKQILKDPPVFLLKNIVSEKETAEMIAELQKSWKTLQEAVGKHHGMVSLDRSPEMNSSAINRLLNHRLAVLSGLPEEYMEEGYCSVYNPGHTMSHLHADNHHTLFTPHRIISVVTYLTAGRTVFPLMQSTKDGNDYGPAVAKEDIAKWDKRMQDSADNFKMGDKPQAGRICPAEPGSEEHEICGKTWERAQRQCESGKGGTINMQRGDAVIFATRTAAAELSARVMHGGCPVKQGDLDKIVIAKFFRAHARPWRAQDDFTHARQAYSQQCAANDKAKALKDEDYAEDYTDEELGLEDDDGLFMSDDELGIDDAAKFGDDEDIDDGEDDDMLEQNIESLVDEFDVGTAEL